MGKKETKIINRNPIVAVMGHVDHGKTSFLDYIRGTKVAEKEAGGITQNTRAHEVTTPSGKKITFLDTPGHEAFSKMRERGANITDFVLLIIAADDGVQPQTKESIEFAKKDGVPIIVGLNKIDLPGIQTQKIKAELASYGVNIEEYGGDVLLFEISAKTGQGINDLLEGIELLYEMNPVKNYQLPQDAKGSAFILESSLDKKIGNVALCLLKAGELQGREYGASKEGTFRVRNYLDEAQKPMQTVTPGQPFWITGLRSTVTTGEIITFFENESDAKDYFQSISKGDINVLGEQITEAEDDVESLFAQMLQKRMEDSDGTTSKELNIVLKTATQGTLEAVRAQLENLSDEEVHVKILISGTGDVTEDEITRAKLAKAIIVTFQLPTPTSVINIARREKVLLRNYEVIYEMIDEVQEVLDSLGSPIEEEIEVARGKIKQVFVLSNGSVVLGCEIIKGNIVKGYRVWIERKGEILHRSKIAQLKILKNEVKEVKKGQECGIMIIDKIEGIQAGDEIVAYRVERLN
jgi:translation initiation factor IF-2